MWVSGVEINGMDLDARLGLKPWVVFGCFLFQRSPKKNNGWKMDRWEGGAGNMLYMSEIKEMIRTYKIQVKKEKWKKVPNASLLLACWFGVLHPHTTKAGRSTVRRLLVNASGDIHGHRRHPCHDVLNLLMTMHSLHSCWVSHQKIQVKQLCFWVSISADLQVSRGFGSTKICRDVGCTTKHH